MLHREYHASKFIEWPRTFSEKRRRVLSPTQSTSTLWYVFTYDIHHWNYKIYDMADLRTCGYFPYMTAVWIAMYLSSLLAGFDVSEIVQMVACLEVSEIDNISFKVSIFITCSVVIFKPLPLFFTCDRPSLFESANNTYWLWFIRDTSLILGHRRPCVDPRLCSTRRRIAKRVKLIHHPEMPSEKGGDITI